MFVDYRLAKARLDERIAEVEQDRRVLQALRAPLHQRQQHREGSQRAVDNFVRRNARAIVQFISRRPVF